VRNIFLFALLCISIVNARRYYDPETALFISVDPEAEKRPWITPYAYAVDNPIRYEDFQGLGPKDRVQAARNQIGTPYQQEGNDAGLRTGTGAEALKYMDCSEFVSRVIAADEITGGIQSFDSKGIKSFFSNTDKFDFSADAPQAGDIAAWEGHVGIVGEVGEGNTIKLIHARGSGKLAKENPYAIAPEKYRPGSKFLGYFRPKVETPEGKVQPK
jgi:hypothetical protein